MVFGRQKKQEPEQPIEPEIPDREGAKNRPTPTRKEREQARRQPLVPEDRKAAARAARLEMRRERDKQRTALVTGDERHMGPRDAGPVRRYVRDVVDSRLNFGEYFLFVAMLSILLVLGPQLAGVGVETAAQFQLVTTALLWGMILMVILDAFRLSSLLRKNLRGRFGQDFDTRGHVAYGVSRSLQIRRWRLPKPAVKRGQAPRA